MTQIPVAARPVADVPTDFDKNIEAAIASAPTIESFVADAVERGVRNVFLVGCGGSLFSFGPLQYLLERLSPVPMFALNADELRSRQPALLGPGSLVVASSTRGETAETVRAAEVARERGATVVGVTQDAASPLAAAVGTVWLHQGVEAKQLVLAQFGWALLRNLGVSVDPAVGAGLKALPGIMRAAIAAADPQLAAIAEALADEPVIYVLGAGPSQSAANTLALCYLQEMQWKHAAALGAGEFLHGAFEVVTDETPVIVLLAEDESRPMGERVVHFLRRYTSRVHVIDTADWELPGLAKDLRPLFTPLLFSGPLTGRLAQHFESVTGHSLRERRYMWKVEY